MPLAEVVTIYATNCRDIPEMLRGAADNIELEQADGITTETMLGIQLTESGSLAMAWRCLRGRVLNLNHTS